MLTKKFDFGVVGLDTGNLSLFIDRGDGNRELHLCEFGELERKSILDWIYSNGVNKEDVSQLAWQAGGCQAN